MTTDTALAALAKLDANDYMELFADIARFNGGRTPEQMAVHDPDYIERAIHTVTCDPEPRDWNHR